MQPRELFQQQCSLIVLLVHCRKSFIGDWRDLGLGMRGLPSQLHFDSRKSVLLQGGLLCKLSIHKQLTLVLDGGK